MNRLYAVFVCWIFLGILSSSIIGCKTIEKVSKKPLKKRGAQHLLAQLKEKELQYQWISAKVSCEATLNNKEVECGAPTSKGGSASWKRLKVGNVNGSYFKRAPKGATQDLRVLWLRLRIEIVPGSSKEFPRSRKALP